jgi:PKD repeat protein
MGQHAAYDGLTTTLPAKFVVTPGETYHVKISLADVGDGVFDSGVFLSVNSLGGDSLLNPVAEMAAPVINGNTVTFDNDSRYGTAWFWDFGDGTTSTERHPGPHTYPQFAADEKESGGVFTVTLITTNYCCSDTTKMVVNLGGGSSSTDTPGAVRFSMSPNPASDWLTIEPLEAQEYTVRILDAGGRTVARQTAAGLSRMDVRQLHSGVYTCQVIQGKTTAQQRFVRR